MNETSHLMGFWKEFKNFQKTDFIIQSTEEENVLVSSNSICYETSQAEMQEKSIRRWTFQKWINKIKKIYQKIKEGERDHTE